MLQSNALNGTLPVELWNLSRLTRLQLESNDFVGSISKELGNLTELQVLTLQGNNFTGQIPSQLCAGGSLKSATVDCAKVECPCCNSCNHTFFEVPLGGGDSNRTTGEPSMSPLRTDIPTDPPTQAPTACHNVEATSTCYAVGDPIDFVTADCDPGPSDVLAMYPTSDLNQFGVQNALFWIPSCVGAHCDSVISNGVVAQADGTSQNLQPGLWPFAANDYILFLFRVNPPGFTQILARSAPFQVAKKCP